MVTEQKQLKRLAEYNINIKTKYKSNEEILERNTDNSKNDNIKEGIRLEKDYYQKSTLVKKENIFDSRIIYNYEFDNDDEITCKNCGMKDKAINFSDGCPYCQTSYNLDFKNKELGNKHYYDLTIKNKNYILKTFLIDLVFSFIITLIYIKKTSRTFYFFDILKVVGASLLMASICFYVFYYLDAYITLPILKRKKEELNKKQMEFWERMQKLGIDKTTFYNNFNYDLSNLYYSDKYKSIIDYDIIDYNYFNEYFKEDNLFVDVNIDIRLVRINNNKVTSKIESTTYTLKKAKLDGTLEGNINNIKCHNCGASIDITKEKCTYCGTKCNYFQEWYLIDTL